MRNLKRVLSLSLASIMLFGMMVVGASAVQGYPDVDKETHNIEAIDVLQTVQVMIGYTEEEGSGFQPDKPVSRAEMMVIMGKLLNLDYNYYSTSCPFTDVPDWAKGWVGAAYANKVAYGRGDGIFDPDSTVTPVEASAFLMRALGYFQYSNDYSDGFELATVRQGTAIDIYHGVSSSATEPMTRNQVAKMVLNTLESGMVQPDGNTINLTTPDGSVLTGKVNYVYVTSNKDFAYAISSVAATAIGSNNTGAIVELGEQLYNGDLKLYDGRLDDFGRPSRRWEYDGKAIGTYLKKDLLKETYTTKVTGKALYEVLGSEVVKDYDFTITIDGETTEDVLDNNVLNVYGTKNVYYFDVTALNRTNTNQVGGTGNGVLTQVFVDGNKKEVYIAIINTYLAIADSDYNERRNEVSFEIKGIEEVTAKGGSKTLVKNKPTNEPLRMVSGDDFDIKDVMTDDVVLVRVAAGEIKEIIDPNVIDEASITSFKTSDFVVADGTQYKYAHSAKHDPEVLDAWNDDNMKNTLYRLYLDPYGYLIGIEIVETEKQYVFLTGINSYTENLKDQTAVGNVIFLDGTSKNVTIDMKNSKNAQGNTFGTPKTFKWEAYEGTSTGKNDAYLIRYDTRVDSLMNTWCTYSVDDNGVYTLKEVANTAGNYGTAKDVTAGNVDAPKNKLGQSHMGGTYNTGDKSNTDAKFYVSGDADPRVISERTVNNLPYTGERNVNGADVEYVTIDKGHVSLDGVVNSKSYKKVYGNNDTVYLTAEVSYLSGAKDVSREFAGNYPAVIITGVDTVSVGVQEVDMKAYNAQAVVDSLLTSEEKAMVSNNLKYTNVSDGVYALFNDKGYVIAAVVVGAADTSTSTFAWVSSKNMNSESLVDGKWEYTRNVIVNGKETTLTEVETVGTDAADISGFRGNPIPDRDSFWWEVKLKADGTVKSADLIWQNGKNYKFVYDINDDTKDGTTILNQKFNWPEDDVIAPIAGFPYVPNTADFVEGYTVRVTGNTLQVEGGTGNIRGFAVSPDATIAVVKDEEIVRNDGAKSVTFNYKEDIRYFTNNKDAGGLKQAVNYLNDSEDFKGYIAAVLKDGRAECVIIYDKSDMDVNIGNVIDGKDAKVFAVEDPAQTLSVYYVGADAVAANNIRLTNAKIEAAIMDHLTNDQHWVVEEVIVDGSNDEATIIYHDATGRTRTVVWNVKTIALDLATYNQYKKDWKDVNWD